MVVQEDPEAPVTGRAADLLAAANTALEAALRLIRPGKRIADVPPVLQKVTAMMPSCLPAVMVALCLLSHASSKL